MERTLPNQALDLFRQRLRANSGFRQFFRRQVGFDLIEFRTRSRIAYIRAYIWSAAPLYAGGQARAEENQLPELLPVGPPGA